MPITNQEKRAVWHDAYSTDKVLWKSLSSLPNKSQGSAALDHLQTWWDSSVAANRVAVDAALGQATTNAHLKSLARSWLRYLERSL